MSSELELSKQRITELEAENSGLRIKLSVSDAEIAELKRSNAEFLRANKEYNERRDAKVNKLEQKNKELETRLAIVEQTSLLVKEQSYNDNPSNDSTSNFNSVAEYHKKPLVDVETDNSFSEEVCYNKQELITEVATVPANSVKHLNGKPLEEKEMDNFLVEVDKKSISNEIRQRNREKKLCFNDSGQAQESLPTHSEEKMSQNLNLVT